MTKRIVLATLGLLIILVACLLATLTASAPPLPAPDAQPTAPLASPSSTAGRAATATRQATPTATADMSALAATLLEQAKAQQAIGDDAAVATLQSLLERCPQCAVADEARFRLAQSMIDAHREPDALTILLALANAEPTGPFAADALFLAAGLQREAGNAAEATDLYTRYVKSGGLLSAYAQREIASLQADLQLPVDAIASYQAALAAGLPDDAVQGMRLRLAQLTTQVKDYEQALSWWSAYSENATSSWERSLATYSSALIHEASGAITQATTAYTLLVQDYPDSSYAVQALDALLAAGVDVPLLQQGQVYFSNRQNEKAVSVYQRYLAQNPTASAAGRVHYNMAILQQRLGNLERALTEFEAVHAQYPNETFARDAWLEEGLTLVRLERKLEAAMFFEKLAVWYPQSTEAEQALWEAGMIYYRLGRPKDAARAFGRLRQGFPKSVGYGRAVLWEAKSLLASGDAAGAQTALALIATDPRPDYYELRAAELLSPTATPAPKQQASAESEHAAFLMWMETWAGVAKTSHVAADASVKRGMALSQLGMHDAAAGEFVVARGARRDDAWALLDYAEYMSTAGVPYESVAAANRILALSGTAITQAPVYLQRLLYPVPYRDLVQAMAKQYGVDWLWLYAQMRQESLFDRYAFSSADARGLTQVIPATGDEIAGRLGVSDFRQEDLFKPLVSLRFGAWYLAQQSKSAGQILVALAAYNGGLGNALKWAKLQSGYDQDLFVEDVAYSETQAYVKLVYQFHSMYAALWGTP